MRHGALAVGICLEDDAAMHYLSYNPDNCNPVCICQRPWGMRHLGVSLGSSVPYVNISHAVPLYRQILNSIRHEHRPAMLYVEKAAQFCFDMTTENCPAGEKLAMGLHDQQMWRESKAEGGCLGAESERERDRESRGAAGIGERVG